MTHATVQVALALSDEPFGRHWGYDLSRRSGVRSGVMYPVLERMLAEGWLADGWEQANADLRRPRRRYYELTQDGRRAIGAVIDQAAADGRFVGLFRVAT